MNLLILKIFQWCIIFLTIVEVICNTKSRNVCQDDTDVLQMKIETGDVLFAGTNSHVSLLLRSGNGVVCQVYDLDNVGNDHERNSIDKYTICCPKGFLDDEHELSMLGLSQLTRTGKYVSFFADNWFIERIEVRADETLLFDYRFHSWTSPSRKLMFGVSKINNTNYTRF
jgi:hypothetical protein